MVSQNDYQNLEVQMQHMGVDMFKFNPNNSMHEMSKDSGQVVINSNR